MTRPNPWDLWASIREARVTDPWLSILFFAWLLALTFLV